ncbi:iron-sulfur cluster assembly factor IBA57, mitochondrial-like [Ciona intestinalis]
MLKISKLLCHVLPKPRFQSFLRKFSERNPENVKFAKLNHRAVVQLSGKDTIEHLQGLVTNDVTLLPSAKCMYAMMLNTQGRIDHNLILYWKDGEVLIDCDGNRSDIFMKLLKKYKLRKKVEILERNDLNIWQGWDESGGNVAPVVKHHVCANPDPRVELMGWRVVSCDQPCDDVMMTSSEDYHIWRYKVGVPETDIDLPPGKSLPLESNLDFMHGINFHKGCYLGQELTARTHHTGVVRKRLTPVEILEGEVPEPGTSLRSENNKAAGRFRGAAGGKHGLALIKLDYEGQILTTSGGTKLKGQRPLWWHNEGGSYSDGACQPSNKNVKT